MFQMEINSDHAEQSESLKIKFESGVVLVKCLPEGLVCEIQDHAGNRIIGSWASCEEIASGEPLAYKR